MEMHAGVVHCAVFGFETVHFQNVPIFLVHISVSVIHPTQVSGLSESAILTCTIFCIIAVRYSTQQICCSSHLQDMGGLLSGLQRPRFSFHALCKNCYNTQICNSFAMKFRIKVN